MSSNNKQRENQQIANPPVFILKTGGFWSGLRDLNPRSLEPKSSAIPNFAKPGYKVEDVSDVVKYVVKSHFRPQFLKSLGRKVLEPQRFFGLVLLLGRSGPSAPKCGALPTGLYPDTRYKVLPDVVKHVVRRILPQINRTFKRVKWGYSRRNREVSNISKRVAKSLPQLPNQAPYQLGHTQKHMPYFRPTCLRSQGEKPGSCNRECSCDIISPKR